MSVFEAPEKRPDGSYMLKFITPVVLEGDLRWEKGASHPTPDLRIQSAINAIREKTLRDLTQNRALFKTAPTLASLKTITPPWGLLIRGATTTAVEWSSQDLWDARSTGVGSLVTLCIKAIQLSRQSIVPVWDVHASRVLPDISAVIDFDFGEGDEGASVHSEDLAAEEGDILYLKDPGERKRQMKAYVRDLLEKASLACMEADAAKDRFFSEYDLSENESDFSDEEDED